MRTCSTSSRTRRRSPSMPTIRRSGFRRLANWSTETSGPTREAACRTTPGCCGRRTFPNRSVLMRTPGIFPGSTGRLRNGPAGTGARCPSSCWVGSCGPVRIPVTWCSTRLPEAAPRWRLPENSIDVRSGTSCPRSTPPGPASVSNRFRPVIHSMGPRTR